MIKKIFLGVLIISVFGVLAIQLWEYIKQYRYINYENKNTEKNFKNTIIKKEIQIKENTKKNF